MDVLLLVLLVFGIFFLGAFLLVLIILYNLYQKSELQRREITTLAQEIAFLRKKLENMKK